MPETAGGIESVAPGSDDSEGPALGTLPNDSEGQALGTLPAAASDIETSVERRRTPRSPMVVRVSYSTVDALFSEFTRNINDGGLFIETETPPATDTRVALQFQLPGIDEPITARGRVAWIRGASDEGPPGIGVEFEHLSAEAREHIDVLVRRLRSAGR